MYCLTKNAVLIAWQKDTKNYLSRYIIWESLKQLIQIINRSKMKKKHEEKSLQ